MNFINLKLPLTPASSSFSGPENKTVEAAATESIVASSSVPKSAPVSASRRPCLDNIRSFSDALLFSIETQHTIGYGGRQPTDECPEVLLLLMLQAITGCLIQCFVVGFVFAKLSRPQKRSQTLVFSKRAVINLCEDPTDFSSTNCLDSPTSRQKSGFNFNRVTNFGNLSNGLDCDAQEICELLRLVSTGQLRTSDFQREDSSEGTSELERGWEIIDPQCTLQSFSGASGRRSFVDNGGGGALYNVPSESRNEIPTLLEPLERVDYSGDQRYRLQFRLGDVREKSHIINARVNAFFLCKENFQLKSDLLPSKGDRAKRKAAHLRCRRNAAVYDPWAGEQMVDDQVTLSGNHGGSFVTSGLMNGGNRCDYGKMVREKKLHNFSQRKLLLTIDSAGSLDGELLLIWPLVVSHEVNEQSPFWGISRSQLRNCKFEIVVVLEGKRNFFLGRKDEIKIHFTFT